MTDQQTEVAQNVADEAHAKAVNEAVANEAVAEKAPRKAEKASKAKVFQYRISRDFWDEKCVRHRKGTIVEMTAEEAQDGLESGALTRVK